MSAVDWTKIVTYRTGFSVTRFHTLTPIRPETVGHHSANVAMLCDLLTEGKASKDMIMYALQHDIAEQYTGDIPATAKWNSSDLRDELDDMEGDFLDDKGIEMPTLSDEEYTIFKCADMMDLCFKAKREVILGNQEFKGVLLNGIAYISGLYLPGTVQDIVNGIITQLRLRA